MFFTRRWFIFVLLDVGLRTLDRQTFCVPVMIYCPTGQQRTRLFFFKIQKRFQCFIIRISIFFTSLIPFWIVLWTRLMPHTINKFSYSLCDEYKIMNRLYVNNFLFQTAICIYCSKLTLFWNDQTFSTLYNFACKSRLLMNLFWIIIEIQIEVAGYAFPKSILGGDVCLHSKQHFLIQWTWSSTWSILVQKLEYTLLSHFLYIFTSDWVCCFLCILSTPLLVKLIFPFLYLSAHFTSFVHKNTEQAT